MQRRRLKKKRNVPEALGNRVCGVWPYVAVLVFDAFLHAIFFFLYGQTIQSFFRLFFSFIFFIYPLYYVADALWSLRPSVCAILSGQIQINRKYYMNTVQKKVRRDKLFPVTISVPVYTESNEIIFETLRQSVAAVRRYREVCGKEANVVVSDDGLAPLLGESLNEEKLTQLVRIRDGPAAALLTQQELKAAERIVFYREHGISFVARPQAGRGGLFKKASNLNYTLQLGNALAGGASLECLFGEDGAFAGGYAEGEIVIHEVILLLDKDSGVKEKVIEAIVPEFASDERLAYVQCATNAANLAENYYTCSIGYQVNNLFHNIWPCKAMQGFFVPLVGHNVFLRKSILEKSGLWSENRVSEDYDKAICLYSMGYHGKYAQLKGLEFTEYVSRTFTEETARQRRYAYGLFEMVFDGTLAPGKARGCDVFFMILYFFSMINQVLLLPTVLLESYFGNIHLLWAGFLLCMLSFLSLPPLRGLVMRRCLPKEHTETFRHTLLLALSYVGHSFSFLAGACRYLANKIRENRKPFPATNVDQVEYRFVDGVKLLAEYIRKNPWLPIPVFLCFDRGIFLLTNRSLDPMTKLAYCYILFCAVLVPVLLTPQIFSGLGRKTAALESAKTGGAGHAMSKNTAGSAFQSSRQKIEGRDAAYAGAEGSVFSLPQGDVGDRMSASNNRHEAKTTGAIGLPSESSEQFLAFYQETLQALLPDENMPEELLSEYVFESCLRKDPEGRKELYLLRRKADDKKALLRITKDYPQEDALEEARLLAGLDHPCIPKLYAAYEKDERNYLVREYVEGRALSDIVSSGGSLAADDIFGITLKIADILHYLHTQTPPVIHRDIKPQNIIAGKDGKIYLIDFGIARVHKEERRQDTSVVLTLDYASPEQYGFEQTTPLSDIYSLGVVILFLATGRTARADLEAQIINNRLRNLIEQCIAFNPKARFQSAAQIRDYILQNKKRRASGRKRKAVAAAVLLAASVGLSALSHGAAFVTEKKHAEKRGYERGFANGYTDGYEAAPVFYRNRTEVGQKRGSSFGNMAVSGGAFASGSEGAVFYLADGGISRMSANGAEHELFVEDENAAALSCDNGWLYYSSGDRMVQTNIYTQASDLLCEDLPGMLYVTENDFYILAEDGLHQLDIETGETAGLNYPADYQSLNVDGETIYFINGDDLALYRADTAGDALTMLSDDKCRSVCLFGTDLYCSVYKDITGHLIRIDSVTGEAGMLLEVDAALLNVFDSGIYYLDLADRTINRCSFDGRTREKISKNRADDYNIAGDWIFYHNGADGGRLWCVRLDGSNDHPVP
jgi:predicted Ser/Thr protein kinase